MTWLFGLCVSLHVALVAHDDPPPLQRPSEITPPTEPVDAPDEVGDSWDAGDEPARSAGDPEAPQETVQEPALPPPIESAEVAPFEPATPFDAQVVARTAEPAAAASDRRSRNAAILLGLSPLPLGLAAGMQYWAYHRYREYCFHDPMLSDGLDGIGEAIGHGIGCGFSLVGTGFIRAGGVVFLAGTVSMATIGSAMLGRHAAEMDRSEGTMRSTGALLGVGTGLMVAGTAAGITSGWILTRRIWNADTDEASLANVRWRSIAFDASAIGVAVGAGMLAYAVAYRRARRHHGELSWWPVVSPSFIGVSGRFG
jgi:hypothetical protein